MRLAVKVGLSVVLAAGYSYAVCLIATREIESSTGSHSSAMWETAISARAGRVDPTKEQTYRAHYNAGHAHVAEGNVLMALKRFRYCYDHAPRGSMTWCMATMWLGVLAEQLGDQDRAKQYYAEYVQTASPVVANMRTAMPGAWRRYREMQTERGDS